MNLGIQGKTALVCGGSSGLGQAIATALANEGAIVTLIARNEEKLERVAAEIQAGGGTKV